MTEKEKTENSDKLSEAIGSFGRWHVFTLILAAIPVKICVSWHLSGIIYLAPKTTFRCVEINSTEDILNSTCYKECTKYEYYSEFDSSIISEWELICDRAWLANFAQMTCMLGVLIGSIIFGFVSDRYGRRPAMLIGSTSQIILSIAIAFSPEYWSFTAIRFLIGCALAGTLMTSYVIMVEITGANKREILNCCYHIPVAIGTIIMPVFAYYLRSWNTFSMGIAVPSLVMLTHYFVVPESPKWLISMGRYKEASLVMSRAAKWNGLPSANMLQIAEAMGEEARVNVKEETKASYMDLLIIPGLRMRNFWSCVIWFIFGIAFYGGKQYIGQTSSNIFIVLAIGGCLETLGVIMSTCFCKLFSRRAVMITFCISTSVSNLVLVLPDDWFYVKLAFGAISIGFAAAAFTTLYMFTSELFPTITRNMAMGASSTASRVGSTIAPFIAGLSLQAYWIPPTVFGIIPLIAAFASFSLPETKGENLKDHLTET